MRRSAYVLPAVIPAIIIVAAAVIVARRDDGASSEPPDTEYEASTTVLESPQHGPELCLGGVATSLPPQCGGVPIVGWDWGAVEDEESANGTTWTYAYVRGTYDGERFTLTQRPEKGRRPPSNDASDFAAACAEPEVVDERDRGPQWEEATQAPGFGNIPGLAAVWVTDPGPDGDPGAFVGNVVVRPGYEDEARAHVRRSWGGKLCVVERDQPSAAELESDYKRLDDVLTAEYLTASVNERRGVIQVELVVVDERSQREVDDAFGEGIVVFTAALHAVH